MTFTPTQKELFNKNIEALNNILLKESLKEIKSSKFELILGLLSPSHPFHPFI